MQTVLRLRSSKPVLRLSKERSSLRSGRRLFKKEIIMKLKNKTAIITGATSGIGRATALLFADEGADLVLTGRRSGLGKTVEAECRQRGVRCVFIEADHTKLEDCQRVVDVTLKEFSRIDILFNNAGIVTKGTAESRPEDV